MSTSIEEHQGSDIEKRPRSEEGSFDEKSSCIDFKDGDEALRLIGAERTNQFSEEYNLKLRRKLVWPSIFITCTSSFFYIFVGLAHPAIMCFCLFHPILVRV